MSVIFLVSIRAKVIFLKLFCLYDLTEMVQRTVRSSSGEVTKKSFFACSANFLWIFVSELLDREI